LRAHTGSARIRADNARVIKRALSRLVADKLVVFWPAINKWADDHWELKESLSAAAKRKTREEAQARAEARERERQKERRAERESARKVDPEMNALTKIAKALGMMGSAHDAEALTAARQAERLRKELGTDWHKLIGLDPE
jgi:hypothetical protein